MIRGPAEGHFETHSAVQNIDARFENCVFRVFGIPVFNVCLNEFLWFSTWTCIVQRVKPNLAPTFGTAEWFSQFLSAGPCRGNFEKHAVVQNIGMIFGLTHYMIRGPAEGHKGALRETFCCAKQWRNIWKLSFRYVLDPGFNFCLNGFFMVFNMNLYRVLRKTKSYANFGHSWMIVEASLGRPMPRKLWDTLCWSKSWRNIWLYALHDTGACRGNFEKHSVVLEIGGNIWKLRFRCVSDPGI